ncbi:MAG: hypothetical protein RLZZ214_1314 [Verrucomicrobiota bacterium]
MKTHLQVTGLIFTILVLPASAVIVAGASGGGNTANNTTEAQFQSEYGLSFPAYDNVVRYSDASGIYLGYDAATKDVWLLTARHVSSSLTQGATVTIDGLVYNRQPEGGDGFGLLPGGDLRLVRYNRLDLAVPTLPAVNISTSIPTAGTGLLMVGYGQNRTQNATLSGSTSDAVSVTVGTGYNWSGTTLKRWGTNQIEGEFLDALETVPVTGTTGTFSLGPYSTTGYMTDFDQPGAGQWLNSNEAQGSLGDSGGSAFYYSGGQWYLSGIFTAVVGFSGQAGNTAAFGNLSLLTDVASYSGAINTALAGVTLIPEPAPTALWFLAGVMIFSSRRRSRV